MASGSSDSISNIGPSKDAVVVDAAVVTSTSAAEQGRTADTDYRANFLDTFTPEEQTRIMRKVDYRLLLLCGVIYMVKQVRNLKLYMIGVNILIGMPT